MLIMVIIFKNFPALQTSFHIFYIFKNYVKIDKSLVWSFADGKNQFLNDLMPMIKAEGKKIIAEGIETEDHIEIIKRLQGDYLQGYFYSKPLPEAEFVRFLQKFNGDQNYPDEKEDEKIKQVELA